MQLRYIIKSFFSVVVLLILGTTVSSAQSESSSDPKQVVQTFQAELLEIMRQGKQLGFDGRYEKFAPAITASHDLPKVARITIGRAWKTLSDEQKQQWVDVFTKLSIASYAHNFKDFSGESFKFVSEEETPNKRGVIIHTYFVIPDDNREIKFDYLMKKNSDSWKIINIIADGVSDLALKRSEYASFLKRNGFDDLVLKVSEKIDNYSQQ